MISVVLTLWSLIASSLFVVSARRYLEMVDRLDEIEEIIENSAEVLGEMRQSIENKSKLEIFVDEPVVRELVSDMGRACTAIEDVKKSLEDILENLNQEQEEEESETKDDKKT